MSAEKYPSLPAKNSAPRMLKSLAFGVATSIVFALAISGWSYFNGHATHRQEALTATENICALLENDIDHIVQKTDLSLLSIRREVEKNLAEGRQDRQKINELIAYHQKLQPGIRAFRVANADGTVFLGPDTGDRKINVADREYFAKARDNRDIGLIISNPVFSRIDKEWVLPIMRRLNNPDGSFAGIIYATVTSEHFRRTFTEVKLGSRGAISLRMADLTLVARFSAEAPDQPGAVGSNKVSAELQEIIRANPLAGNYIAKTAIDQVERANSYRQVSNYPLILVVGLSTGDYLASWRHDMAKIFALSLMLIVISIVSAWSLYRSWQQLRSSEANLDKIFTASPVGIFLLSQDDRRILRINDEFTRISGYSAEEILGQPISSLGFLDKPEQLAPDRPLPADGNQLQHIETEARRKAGQGITLLLSTEQVVVAGTSCTLITMIDISERKRTEQARETALAAAENLSRLKSEFVNNMSHELRTPLNGVIGLSEIAQKTTDLAKTQRYCAQIHESGLRLLSVVEDVLDFSHITSGELQIRPQASQLPKLLSQTCRFAARSAQAKGLGFRQQIAADLPASCLIDGPRLQQVLTHLLRNAISFTEQGEIAFTARRNGKQLILQVSDTGIGISAEQQTWLFEPFKQVDGSSTRSHGGTGLGLALSARLVELMGGSISVNSKPGAGSLFEIALPLTELATTEQNGGETV